MTNNYILQKMETLLKETKETKQMHLKDVSNTKLVVIDVYTLRYLLEFATKYLKIKNQRRIK